VIAHRLTTIIGHVRQLRSHALDTAAAAEAIALAVEQLADQLGIEIDPIAAPEETNGVPAQRFLAQPYTSCTYSRDYDCDDCDRIWYAGRRGERFREVLDHYGDREVLSHYGERAEIRHRPGVLSDQLVIDGVDVTDVVSPDDPLARCIENIERQLHRVGLGVGRVAGA
jgi:hypothetical protein